ncbi:uncharacterized protein LOC101644532 [Echinops telfairi]|uniref:Uncharacterized protein LOC101644532 n=1 Tax=Echinops telfairi TaxID=9371 RepID=A0AC55DA68_ECHTE|nr:uncharacterized protein LOC101644532 [Echinops telfairi]
MRLSAPVPPRYLCLCSRRRRSLRRPQQSQPRKTGHLGVTGSPDSWAPGSHRSGRSLAPHAHPPAPPGRGAGRGTPEGLVGQRCRRRHLRGSHQVSARTALPALNLHGPGFLTCETEVAVVQTPQAAGKIHLVALHPGGLLVTLPSVQSRACQATNGGPRLFSVITEGLLKWAVDHGGDGWVVEENRTPVPGAPAQTCFVSSFSWCHKRQVVNLKEEGFWPELLDSGRIEIVISDWWGARHDCGCQYKLIVQLWDANQVILGEFFATPNPIEQWNNNAYVQVTHLFSNVEMGVRYVFFEHRGRDTQFWAGHYGARITNSSVIVRIIPS